MIYFKIGDTIIMAKKNEEFVQQITSRDVDFPQWYTDVVLKTNLVDYSLVRGCMVLRPYGYAIWELIQSELDRRFKETGHQNAYFPLLIPESLLKKEAEHVEGFAPEVLWVTEGGTEKLTERLAIRPTSETIICSMYSKWVQSYRDLPLLYNQWANVVRWEKTTRPFLRTAEFLWQEGHTIHATMEEAETETIKMLNVYREFCENVLAMPVTSGRKTENEKFAGAVDTYSIEALMHDGKALQAGTSHFLGQHFSKVYDIKFLDKDGKQKYAWQTSWGVTTRLIGGLIMVHGDDRGLKLPPAVAPKQVMIIPIAMFKPGVLDKANELFDEIKKAGIRVDIDDDDTQSPGYKFNECEMKGIPVRLEVGPRDIENKTVVLVRRDTFEKTVVPMENIAQTIKELLADIQKNMLAEATKARDEHTYPATNHEELMDALANKKGYIKAMWCGCTECEKELKAQTGATIRNMPFEQENLSDVCALCGKPAKHMVYIARAY